MKLLPFKDLELMMINFETNYYNGENTNILITIRTKTMGFRMNL